LLLPPPNFAGVLWNSYPTLYFFPSNDKQNPIPVSALPENDMINFLSKYVPSVSGIAAKQPVVNNNNGGSNNNNNINSNRLLSKTGRKVVIFDEKTSDSVLSSPILNHFLLFIDLDRFVFYYY
jgi:hypothetical protein